MRIQSIFSEYTRHVLCKRFEINEDEFIVSAIYVAFGRMGFVFTDRRFYWNLPTTVERSDSIQEIDLPSNILQRNAEDMQVDLEFKAKKNAPDGKKAAWSEVNDSARPEFLVFNSYIGKVRINISGMDIDDARKLRRIFIDYISRDKFPYEYLKQDPLDSITFAFEAVQDFVIGRGSGVKIDRKAREKESLDEVQYIHSQNNTQDVKSFFTARTRRRITPAMLTRFLMRFVFDTVADLLFLSTVVFSLKPILLYRGLYQQHSPVTDFLYKIGTKFFMNDIHERQTLLNMEITGEVVDQLIYRRNYIFIILISIFVLAKLFVVFLGCKGKKRILPLIITALSVMLTMTMCTHFALFAAGCILLYILMQFAMGMGWETLRYKMLATIMLSFMTYYFLHLFNYPGFVDVMAAVVQRMNFPVSW